MKKILTIVAIMVLIITGGVMFAACNGDGNDYDGHLLTVETPSSGLRSFSIRGGIYQGSLISWLDGDRIPDGTSVDIEWASQEGFIVHLYINNVRQTGASPITMTVESDLNVRFVSQAINERNINVVRPTQGTYTSFNVFASDDLTTPLIGTTTVREDRYLSISWERVIGYTAQLFINGQATTHSSPHIHNFTADTTIELRTTPLYFETTFNADSGVAHFSVEGISGVNENADNFTQDVREGRVLNVSFRADNDYVAVLEINGVQTSYFAFEENTTAQVTIEGETTIRIIAVRFGEDAVVCVSLDGFYQNGINDFRVYLVGSPNQLLDIDNGSFNVGVGDRLLFVWERNVGYSGVLRANDTIISLDSNHTFIVIGDVDIELEIVHHFVDVIVGAITLDYIHPEMIFSVVQGTTTLNQGTNRIREGSSIVIVFQTHPRYLARIWINGVIENIDSAGTWQILTNTIINITTVPNPNYTGDTSNNVTVTFNLNSAPGTPPAPQTVILGSTIFEPTAPNRDGYAFLGWFMSPVPVDDARWNFAVNTVLFSRVLFAGWEARDPDYEDTFYQWEEGGYIYFHYLARNADGTPWTQAQYEEWAFWVWPGNPGAPGGVDASFSHLSETSGGVFKIDFTTQHTGGWPRPGTIPHYFPDNNNLSFLIVNRASRGVPGAHWVSDGGDILVSNIWSELREPQNNIHIFIERGRASQFRFNWLDEMPHDYWQYVEFDGDADTVGNVFWRDTIDDFPIVQTAQPFLHEMGVGYQIFVPSFATSPCATVPGFGTLRGVINNLDYIESLSVGVIWLTPINEAISYHLYDVTCFYSIDPRVGTMEDFEELIYEAGERGIKVIMDLVPNHTSNMHPWFQRSQLLEPQFRNWFSRRHISTLNRQFNTNWNGTGSMPAQWGNWHRMRDDYFFYGSFGSHMPDLNFDYQPVRDEMVNIANFWLERGVAGFRLDAVKHIYDWTEWDRDTLSPGQTETNQSGTNLERNVHFWREFNYRVKENHPDAFLIGENLDGNQANLERFFEGMDSQFNFNMYFYMNQAFGNVAGFRNRFESHQVMNNRGRGANLPGNTLQTHGAIEGLFTSNHDVPRMINVITGRPGHGRGIDVGNHWNQGDAVLARNRLHVMSSALLTLPGITWIYYGDELGMEGYMRQNTPQDGTNNATAHVDRWVRQPFKFSTNATVQANRGGTHGIHVGYMSQAAGTIRWSQFNQSLPGVDEQNIAPDSTLNRFREFAAAASLPTMTRGTLSMVTNVNANVFAFQMSYNGSIYRIYHNFSNSAISQGANGFNPGNLTNVIAASHNATAATLPAWGSIIVSL